MNSVILVNIDNYRKKYLLNNKNVLLNILQHKIQNDVLKNIIGKFVDDNILREFKNISEIRHSHDNSNDKQMNNSNE